MVWSLGINPLQASIQCLWPGEWNLTENYMWWRTRNALALFLQEIPAHIHTCWCLTTNRTPSNLFTPGAQKMPSKRKGQEPITSFDNNDPQPCSPTLLLPTTPPPHSSTLSESIHLSSLFLLALSHMPQNFKFGLFWCRNLNMTECKMVWMSDMKSKREQETAKKNNWLFITFLLSPCTTTHLLRSYFSMSSVVPSFFFSLSFLAACEYSAFHLA